MLIFSDRTFSVNHLCRHILSICCQLLSGVLSVLNVEAFISKSVTVNYEGQTTSENVGALIFAVCIVNATHTKMFWQLAPFLSLIS